MEQRPQSSSEPRPPRIHTDFGPLQTDSMVTISLSDQFTPEEIEPNCRLPSSPPGALYKTTEDTGEGRTDAPAPESAAASNSESKTPSTSVTSYSSARSRSSDGSKRKECFEDSDSVDWDELEKTEELESRIDPDDESTALLLARLEQENNALATNPKSGLSGRPRETGSRPPSIQQLKKLINDPSRGSLRYSQLPTPQMTELEFWAALVADYPRTAQRLPTLTSNKIRGGIPPPLRGVVWPSIAGARDPSLLEEFEKLCGESSPYEGLIGKDIGRSFPNVEMFRDPSGEGQQMLGRVLKCFSLYESKIGYCQGLGFVVGPLLMHMSEAEAFCVLVRLMDHYDLRSCFLPTLSGLHLRIYQFQTLLSRHLPDLHCHFDSLKIEPVYVSQWFLSFFAVTCPLPMLLRIYDVLLLEGACETLMRVALSLMQRNEKKLLSCKEFEDVMQHLLSRSIWDTYACNADDLVRDFVSLTSLVTRESLQALEASYRDSQSTSASLYFPQMQAVASRFLGRLWAGSASHTSTKSLTLSPGGSISPSRPESVVRRTPSKQSMASTLNSLESASDASTALTDFSSTSNSTSDGAKRPKAIGPNRDKDLHTQIEDLLMALTDMQRQHAALVKELQREREEREEDQQVSRSMLGYIKERCEGEDNADLIARAEGRFSTEARRLSILQTKHQLRDDVAMWKEKHGVEAARCRDLSMRLDEHEKENLQLKEQLREARCRIQEGHRETQRLERTIQELRSRRSPQPESPREAPSYATAENRGSLTGLREFKLGKASSPQTPTFSKRTSSLNAPVLLSADPHQSGPEDSLLLELANAKTSEAIARQELEEVRAKLDSLRKLMGRSGVTTSPRPNPVTDASANITLTTPVSARGIPKVVMEPSKIPAPPVSGGGFFSGWAKRSASTSTATFLDSK